MERKTSPLSGAQPRISADFFRFGVRAIVDEPAGKHFIGCGKSDEFFGRSSRNDDQTGHNHQAAKKQARREGLLEQQNTACRRKHEGERHERVGC